MPIEAISDDEAAAQILNSPNIELLDPKETDEVEEEVEETAESTEDTEETEEEEETVEAVEIDPEAEMFEVEIKDNGKLVETKTLSLNELKNGYKRQADYSREMQALVDQRNEVKSEVRKGIEQEQEHFKQALEVQQRLVWEIAAAEFQNVNLDQLANDDPAEYIRAQNRLNRINQAIHGIHAELQKAEQDKQDYINNVILPKARQEIKRDLPNWTDDLQISTGKTYGFAPEEVTNIPDPRMVKVLHDAYQYQQIKAQKPIADKKVTAKPKVVKPGTKQTTKYTGEAAKRLAKTGKVQDAAAAILETMQ